MTSRRYVPVREIDSFVSGEVVDLPLNLEQQARVTLVLRPRTPHRTMREHLDHMAGHLPHQRRYFTREELPIGTGRRRKISPWLQHLPGSAIWRLRKSATRGAAWS